MSADIVLLNDKHDRKSFLCKHDSLNNYLYRFAKQDVKRNIARCYVKIDGVGIIGYYTLSSCSIELTQIPENLKTKMPKYENVPVILLGRLAVDKRHEGKGYGKQLLIDSLNKAYETNKIVASFAVVVDPIDSSAIEFYQKYGFVKLNDSQKLFLPMSLIKNLFEAVV